MAEAAPPVVVGEVRRAERFQDVPIPGLACRVHAIDRPLGGVRRDAERIRSSLGEVRARRLEVVELEEIDAGDHAARDEVRGREHALEGAAAMPQGAGAPHDADDSVRLERELAEHVELDVRCQLPERRDGVDVGVGALEQPHAGPAAIVDHHVRCQHRPRARRIALVQGVDQLDGRAGDRGSRGVLREPTRHRFALSRAAVVGVEGDAGDDASAGVDLGHDDHGNLEAAFGGSVAQHPAAYQAVLDAHPLAPVASRLRR